MIHLVKILVKVVASLISLVSAWVMLALALIMWDAKFLSIQEDAWDRIWSKN